MRRLRLAATVAALALVAPACAFGMSEPVTEQGEATFSVWKINVWAGIAVALIVYGLIAWSIIKHRRRKSDPEDVRGASFRENLKLEVVYTAIPVVIIIVLFFFSLSAEQKVTAVSPDPDLIVQTEAFTWGWRFTYPEQGIEIVSQPVGDSTTVGTGPQLVLPVGKTTRIELSANDTIHAFWVPGFLFKRDAIPGHPTEFDVTPTKTGTYRGVCAELCGYNHAYMVFTVKVVPADEFESWSTEQASLVNCLDPTTPCEGAPSPPDDGFISRPISPIPSPSPEVGLCGEGFPAEMDLPCSVPSPSPEVTT